jgi:hypothetical protein
MSQLDSIEALTRDYLPLRPVTYSPRIGVPEPAPLPSERDFVRIEALTSPVSPIAPAIANAGAVEVLSASPSGRDMTVLWRLTRPLPAESFAGFVMHADGQQSVHALLYGWVRPDDLPTATVFRQYLPLPEGRLTWLTVTTGDETAPVPIPP